MKQFRNGWINTYGRGAFGFTFYLPEGIVNIIGDYAGYYERNNKKCTDEAGDMDIEDI